MSILHSSVLESLAWEFLPHMEDIFTGQNKTCQRHQAYKQGGAAKASLRFDVGFGSFRDEQINIVIDILKEAFCKRHRKAEQILMYGEDQLILCGGTEVIFEIKFIDDTDVAIIKNFGVGFALHHGTSMLESFVPAMQKPVESAVTSLPSVLSIPAKANVEPFMSAINISDECIVEPLVSTINTPSESTVTSLVSALNTPAEASMEPIMSENTIPAECTVESLVSDINTLGESTDEKLVSEINTLSESTATSSASELNIPAETSMEPIMSENTIPGECTVEPLVSAINTPVESTVESLVSTSNTPFKSTVTSLVSAINTQNVVEASKIFNGWLKKAKKSLNINPDSKRKKDPCPYCNEFRYDLRQHVIKVHKMAPNNAKGLKSQLGMYKKRKVLPEHLRKSKVRVYQRRQCPMEGCGKMVSRLDNHLRQTHRIKDNVVFQKLLRSSGSELEDIPPATDGETEESEDEFAEYNQFKKTLRNHGKSELKLIDARVDCGDPENDPYDDDDPDWIVNELSKAEEAQQKKRRMVSEALDYENQQIQQSTTEYVAPKEILDVVPENTSEDTCYDEVNPESPDLSDDSGDDEDEEINTLLSPGWAVSFIDKFVNWLKSVDGGNKDDRSARQRGRQVLYIWKQVSPEFNLKGLVDKMALRDYWLTPFEVGRRPGTIRTYFCSLALFYQFIICDKPNVSVALSDCHRMLRVTKNWSSTYKQKVKMRKMEKQLEDLSELLSPQELASFDHSDTVDDCRQKIKSCAVSGKQPTLRLFSATRDYLLTSLILSNATRPGALRNMTLKEVENGVVEDNVFLIRVLDHKTAATSGPAVVAMSTFLRTELSHFIKHIRNKLPGVDNDPKAPVFVSWSGRKMSASLVGDQFNAFFNRATCSNLSRKITATLVRKSFVSKVHGEIPSLKKDLSNMMCHSESTAASSYFLEEKTKNVAKTFKAMHSAMRQNSKDTSKDTTDNILNRLFSKAIDSSDLITINTVREHADVLSELPLSEVQIRDRLRYLQKASIDFHKENPNHVLNGDAIIPPTPEFSSEEDIPRRVTYLRHEEDLIKTSFKSMITNPTVFVRCKDVESVVSKDTALLRLKQKYGLRRMLVKVRTEKKKYASK